MKQTFIFSFLAVVLVGCGANNISQSLLGIEPEASPSVSSTCHQQARDYVKKNLQVISTDWIGRVGIKDEEYRQYKICVDKQKQVNS